MGRQENKEASLKEGSTTGKDGETKKNRSVGMNTEREKEKKRGARVNEWPVCVCACARTHTCTPSRVGVVYSSNSGNKSGVNYVGNS